MSPHIWHSWLPCRHTVGIVGSQPRTAAGLSPHRICGVATAAVDDLLRAALQAGNHAGRGEMVLLQSQGSFFAYTPVLKALQRAQLPLARFLVYPGSGVGPIDLCISQQLAMCT